MKTLKLPLDQRKAAERLVGKTIAKVDLRPFDPDNGYGNKYLAVDPIITFTDGTVLQLDADQTCKGPQDVKLVLMSPKKAHRNKKVRNEED